MSDFEKNLAEQVSLLEDYADLYDQGKVGHARSIAGRLDVILDMLRSEDGGKFVKAHGVTLWSNAPPKNANAKEHGYHPLSPLFVSTTVGSGVASAAFFPVHRTPTSIYASKDMKIGAWSRECILASKGEKHSISRGELIKQMRNKDGGSHPYSEPDLDYKGISDRTGLGLFAFGPAGQVDYDPPAHIATMRHMAWEVLVGLKPHLP